MTFAKRTIIGLTSLGIFLAKPPRAVAVNFNVGLDLSNVSLTAAPPPPTPTAQNLVVSVPNLLPVQAFYGKDVVIPVEIQGAVGSTALGTNLSANPGAGLTANLGGASVAFPAPGTANSPASPTGVPALNASSLAMSLVYQLVDKNENALGLPVNVPIAFKSVLGKPDNLQGSIVVPAQNLLPLRHGGVLSYWFQVQRGAQQLQFKSPGGAPFQVMIITDKSFPVSSEGSVAVLPDTYLTDGKTTVSFAPGSLSGSGTLEVRQVDIESVPSGPGGLSPIEVFNFELQGATLQREARIMFSYPAHTDGTLIGSNGNPQDLAPYWMQGSDWLVLGPRQWDSTMHTVAVTSPHFSTFALFLSGATSAADLRPRERVLTPNGDGVNDIIRFSIIATDGVHIFDMRGRRVKSLPPNTDWDGSNDEGSIVESGLYLYQYTSQGDRVSGVILVAK